MREAEYDPRLAFSIASLAPLIGVSQSFLRLEINRRRLRPTRLGKRVLISRPEIHRYLREHTRKE
jgi:excisionase family DNA binding protein